MKKSCLKLFAVLGLFLAPGWAATAGSITRNLTVDTTPEGATVYVATVRAGVTPLTIPKQEVQSEAPLKIQVVKEGYAPEGGSYAMNDVKAVAKHGGDPWKLSFTLTRIREVIPTTVSSGDGATVFVDGQSVGPVPLKTGLVFSRPDKTSAWNTIEVRVERPNYLAQTQLVTMAMVEAAGTESLKLNFDLAEIRRTYTLDFKANIPDATVTVDGAALGNVPLKHEIVFSRADGSQPWPTVKVEIAKTGYEYRLPDQEGDPELSTNLTTDAAASGLISADYFVPVKFVMTPVRWFEIVNDKMTVVGTNMWAEISEREEGRSLTPYITTKPENPLVVSRISVVPDQADVIVYSVPKRERRPGGADDNQIIGANIWMSTEHSQTPMTDGEQFDVDPFVTADAKWIYFSSDRLRNRCIWRMSAQGRGGVTKITGDLGSIDTEAAVSPDGTKLAYTSRPVGALPTTPSYIWTANADGSLPTQTLEGHSPAWSPDGKKIAFVSSEHKIWTMSADGSNPTQMTQGDSNDAFPVWAPSGKQLFYACDRALNDKKKHNYDIWMISADGSSETQLTQNGSYDSSPAVSSDGRYLYFFSNRGSQKTGEENLQIFRLDLPGD